MVFGARGDRVVRRGLGGTIAALAAATLTACATASSTAAVEDFCEAWRAHTASLAAHAPAVSPAPGQPPPPLRPILSTAPEDINEIVGRYAIGVEKHKEDHDARSQIEEYVATNCP